MVRAQFVSLEPGFAESATVGGRRQARHAFEQASKGGRVLIPDIASNLVNRVIARLKRAAGYRTAILCFGPSRRFAAVQRYDWTQR